MMKKLLIVLIVLTTLGCGSKRKIVTKKDRTVRTEIPEKKEENISTEPVVVTDRPVINSTEGYIETFKDIAINEMELYGIPASITLAQGILESGSGKGRLATEANNHFGIKCHDWTGPKIYHDDDRSQECFRKYGDAAQSFRDHSEFLAKRQRYSKLFELRINDYRGWARELRRAGYATDRRYPEKLIGLIERFGLDRFDKGSASPSEEISVTEHVVKEGDTLYSISRFYGLSVEAIRQLNRLEDNTIKIGQTLILPSKEKK